MRHGKYIGPRADLRGCGALLRPARHSGLWLAQLDCMRGELGAKARPGDGLDESLPLCFGWHEFPRKDFKLDRSRSRSHWRKITQWRWARTARGTWSGGPANLQNIPREPAPGAAYLADFDPMPIRRDQSGWMP